MGGSSEDQISGLETMPDWPANLPQIPQCCCGGGDRMENSPKLNQGQLLWITGGHDIPI